MSFSKSKTSSLMLILISPCIFSKTPLYCLSQFLFTSTTFLIPGISYRVCSEKISNFIRKAITDQKSLLWYFCFKKFHWDHLSLEKDKPSKGKPVSLFEKNRNTMIFRVTTVTVIFLYPSIMWDAGISNLYTKTHVGIQGSFIVC